MTQTIVHKRRVVVTGVGAVCPLGNSAPAAWQNLLSGISGINLITAFDVSQFATQFGGTVKNFDISRYLNNKEAKKMDPFIHYGIAAAAEAIQDAGFEIHDANAERVGIAIGSGIGGLYGIEQGHNQYLAGGPRKISPFFVPSNIINMIAGNLSILYGCKGPNYAIVTACAAGTHNIGNAARMIVYGDADVMIAGGAEMPISPMGLGGFGAARALSTRNDEPAKASRPWDRGRDGFVLSEGAAVLVLEAYDNARQRGANIYAELTGFGMSGDAYHMTSPPTHGEGAACCMKNALRDAAIAPEQIDYINAHGTSTSAGDLAEVRAVKSVFGEYAHRLAMSSSKSMTGHLLGAAGSLEAVFCVLALRDQVIPPTINLDDPDNECDLDFVPHTAREQKLEIVMSNSFGFGGTNGTLIFQKLRD